MGPKKNLKILAVAITIIVFIGFFGLLVWGMLNKQPITGLSGITMVDRPAPDFTLS